MLYRDPISATNKKKSKPLRWLFALAVLIAAPAYFYGPRLYYQFSDDPLARMARRADSYLKLRQDGVGADALLKYVDESLTILGILEKDQSYEPAIHYHYGFFYFQEVLLRTEPTAVNLVQLVGRGYLPAVKDLGDERQASVARLARLTGIRMRRAVAMKPDIKESDLLHLGLAYADLFYTARTDLALGDQIAKAERSKLPPTMQPFYDWMSYVVIVTAGDLGVLQKKLKERKGGLELTEEQAALLECYAAFRGGRYLDALRSARQLRGGNEGFAKVEGLRMEAEVFLKQRGPRTALPYFRQALAEAGGNDSFLKARVRTVSKQL